MNVTEAAHVYEQTKRELDELTVRNKAAKDVLLDWFRSSGKQSFRGRIGYGLATYLALDTDAVKAHLADDLPDFQVRRQRETLSLLKEPA